MLYGILYDLIVTYAIPVCFLIKWVTYDADKEMTSNNKTWGKRLNEGSLFFQIHQPTFFVV